MLQVLPGHDGLLIQRQRWGQCWVEACIFLDSVIGWQYFHQPHAAFPLLLPEWEVHQAGSTPTMDLRRRGDPACGCKGSMLLLGQLHFSTAILTRPSAGKGRISSPAPCEHKLASVRPGSSGHAGLLLPHPVQSLLQHPRLDPTYSNAKHGAVKPSEIHAAVMQHRSETEGRMPMQLV